MPRVCWVLFLALALFSGPVRSEPQVPCYFIFGDSLVDNGNNNDMASLARANYPPYGIDFPGGASGRFTNGLTTVDVIGKFFYCQQYKKLLNELLSCCFFQIRYINLFITEMYLTMVQNQV